MNKTRRIGLAGLMLSFLGCDNASYYGHNDPDWKPCEQRVLRYRGTPTIVSCPNIDYSLKKVSTRVISKQSYGGGLIAPPINKLLLRTESGLDLEIRNLESIVEIGDEIVLKYRLPEELQHLDYSNVVGINRTSEEEKK